MTSWADKWPAQAWGMHLTWPIDYIIIWFQVDGVQGYDEDQITLVIPDLFSLVAQVPVILGTPLISHTVNVIKEREIVTLVTPWVNAWVVYLLVVQWATTIVKMTSCYQSARPYWIRWSSHHQRCWDDRYLLVQIIHAQMRTACTGIRLNVMTQALCAKEGSLPQGLTIQNAYTKMSNGSKNVTIVVINSMVYPKTLKKKVPVARVVAANQVPEPQMQPRMIETLDDTQGI